jgi:hypothetical protein
MDRLWLILTLFRSLLSFDVRRETRRDLDILKLPGQTHLWKAYVCSSHVIV